MPYLSIKCIQVVNYITNFEEMKVVYHIILFKIKAKSNKWGEKWLNLTNYLILIKYILSSPHLFTFDLY